MIRPVLTILIGLGAFASASIARADNHLDDAADKQVDHKLEELRGDAWAAYTAAFLSSVLFEVDKSFEEAFAQNLEALGEQTGQTPVQIVGQMNAQIAEEKAAERAAAATAQKEQLEAIGDKVFESYMQATDSIVVGETGFGDYATSTTINTSAIMVQDALIGNNLQLRYQLNTLKTATGDIPDGNFVTQPGYEVYGTVKDTLRDIGHLEAEGADDDLIDAKKDELTDFLELPGMEGTEEHFTRRTGFIDFLTPLAEDAASKYSRYQRLDGLIRIKKSDRQMYQTANFPRDREKFDEYRAELDARDAEIAALEAELAGLTPEQSDLDFHTALNQSPFLSAPIEVEGFSGPLWEYLGGEISGFNPVRDTSYRTPEKDQEALDQAINFLDDLTLQVAFEYGTIVEGEEMVRTYGGPALKALRDTLTTELTPIIPGTGAYMAELESVFELEWSDTEYSRLLWDAGSGMVALVVAGVIILVPPTAPVLVPVELGLMGTQIVVEGDRLVGAYQDYAATETLAESGAGDHTALTRYGDVLNAQSRTFILTTGLNVFGASGSLATLDDAARALNQVDNATTAGARAAGGATDDAVRGADSATAGLDDTQIFRPGAFDPAPPTNYVDADTFRNMTADQQARALDGLPESAQARLMSQLSDDAREAIKMQEAIATERVYLSIVRGIREDPGAVAVMRGNTTHALPPDEAAARIAEMTDMEIVQAVRTGGIQLTRESRASLLAEVGDDIDGPFTHLPAESPNFVEMGGDMPPPGYWFPADSTQDQVDDLFRINVDDLPPADRQAVILQKADAIRQGRQPSFGALDEETKRALVETMIARLQALEKRMLNLEELENIGWNLDWGPPPGYGRPPVVNRAGGAGDSWDIPESGFDDGSGTVYSSPGGPATSDSLSGNLTNPGVPRGMENAPVDKGIPGWNAPVQSPPQPQPFLSLDEIFGNRPYWMDTPVVPGTGSGLLPSGRAPWGPPGSNSLLNRILGTAPPAPGFTRVGSGTVLDDVVETAVDVLSESSTIIHLAPRWWELPPGKGPLWRNFLFRAFTIGACNLEWKPECENDTPIGVLWIPEGEEDEVAAAISGDPRVAYAEPNSSRSRLAAANDPLYESGKHPDQWYLRSVGLDAGNEAWPTGDVRGDGIVVAIIDTGLAWNHPDFDQDSLWINEDEIPANGFDDDGNGYTDDVMGWNFIDHKPVPWDFDGHGTLVASVIAATTNNEAGIAGINPDVRIMPLKAVDNYGRSRASYVAEAIVYAANNDAKIINLSVGGGGLTYTEQLAVDYAVSRGILVIAGAGNDGQSLEGYGPAGAKRVLTVAASDNRNRRMSFSNYGPQVDLTAPGVDIVGLRAPATDLMVNAASDYEEGGNFVGDDGIYYRATGTSFAAPIVAGVASLVWQKDPSLKAGEVRQILEQTATDIEAPGRDDYTGYGIINAQDAMSSDREFYIDAEIATARRIDANGQAFLQILGIADANQFGGAHLEMGQGESPTVWMPVGEPITAPRNGDELGRIPAAAFAGSRTWAIRLVVTHLSTVSRDTVYIVDVEK